MNGSSMIRGWICSVPSGSKLENYSVVGELTARKLLEGHASSDDGGERIQRLEEMEQVRMVRTCAFLLKESIVPRGRREGTFTCKARTSSVGKDNILLKEKQETRPDLASRKGHVFAF